MLGDLSRTAVEAALAGAFGRPARVLDSIASTNSDALEWAAQGAPHGAVVVAGHQTAGRGRWGRAWLSQPGRHLPFSLVLRPRLPVTKAGLLTTALGVAVAEGVEAVSGLRPALRWPNDVTVGGRKLAGILVESRLAADVVDVAVAGVGINVAWPCAELPAELRDRATSISCELERAGAGTVPGRAEVLGAVLGRIESLYALAAHPSGAPEVIGRASQRSEVLGRAVRLRLATGEAVDGTATRLLDSGSLEVASADGARAFEAGEVERLLQR